VAAVAGDLVPDQGAVEMKRVFGPMLLAIALQGAVNQSQLDRIPTRMKAFVDAGTASGFVTLVAVKGAVVQLSAVGYQDREAKTPMRTDTIFQVMSLTKAVTSASIMTLVDEGRIAPIDPVEKYVPEFKEQFLKNGNKAARPLQIADLLSHTSGLAGGFPEEFKDLGRKYDRTLKDLVAAIGQAPLESQPGEVWRYSNAGMATLGRIVEVVSGTSYSDYVAAHIFGPLAMKDSFFFVTPDRRARIASVYTDDHGTLKKADVNLYREGSIYPAPEGGLYTTAYDYFRFYQMLANRGTLDGKRVLSPAAVELMTMNHTGELKAGFAPGQGYGFGLCVVRSIEGMFRFNSIGTFSHGGAWRTYAFGDPKKELVGVVMYQRTNGGGDIADETNAFIEMANAALEY
jgi:CubicO group peptidase (beta-lactamase class C family)